MLSVIQFFPILVLFIFLHHSIHAYAGNPLPPHSALDNYAYHHSAVDFTHSPPNLRKQAFSRVNIWMTGVVILLTVLNIVVYKLREIHEQDLRQKYKPSQQSCRRFLLADILSATNRFDDSLIVGQGGFGKVYRGVIDDGSITVAIKRLNPWSKQGAPEFWSEIEMLSTIRHTNIVSLIGYCDDCDEMILIYDYMVRGTLAHNIHINRRQSALPWSQRLKICIGAAHGLDYLHTGTGEHNRIIHRDVKSSNILLAENWTAKVSDFGLSKIGPTNQLHTHVSTNVKGTFGYIDPECYVTHKLTRKSDVYSFGVVLFEVLCGRRAVDLSLCLEQRSLAGWAQDCIKEGKLYEIIDPSLRGQILSDSLTVFSNIADQCLHMFSTKRPTMAEVVVALELALTKHERRNFSFDEDFSMNIGGDSNNQENGESSVREELVINEYTGIFRSAAESSVRAEVVVTNKSQGTLRRRRAFTKTMWKFFFGTGPVISGGDNQPTEFGQLRRFDLRELQLATDNFSNNNLVGGGGFGKVYKGLLDDNTKVAVKRIRNEWPAGGELQFQTEVEIKSVAVHRNILRLIGFCMTKTERILVYPFMHNLSVAHQLGGIQRGEYILDWSRRKQVALGTARALEYLHEHSNPKIIHRDVKAGNILLDENFEAFLSDFGRAKLINVEDTHAATAVRGTIGYIAPEYFSTGKVSVKAEVFSYGMFLVELITGQRLFDLARLANAEDLTLLDYALNECLQETVPPATEGSCDTPPPPVELSYEEQAEILASQGQPSRGTRVPGFGQTHLDPKKRGNKSGQCSSSSSTHLEDQACMGRLEEELAESRLQMEESRRQMDELARVLEESRREQARVLEESRMEQALEINAAIARALAELMKTEGFGPHHPTPPPPS